MISTLTSHVTAAIHSSRSLGYVGIDMGTSSVKVAQVRRVGRELVLESARIVRHRQALDPRNLPLSLELMLESLDQAWAPTGHWIPDDAACLLPLPLMLLRTIDLPTSDPAEQQRTIESELSHDASLSAGEMIFECWRETGKDNRTSTASVLGIGSQLVDTFAESLFQRGLACEVLDGHPFALNRAIQLRQQSASTGPVAAVDWGYESSLVTVSSQGAPVYTRPLRDCGFRHVVEAVGEALELGPTDVQQLICGSTFTSHQSLSAKDVQELVVELAAAPLQRFEAELCRTLTFLRQQRPALVPVELCLMGGGSTLRGIDSWITRVTGIEAAPWMLSATRLTSPLDSRQASLLAPAIALSALRFES